MQKRLVNYIGWVGYANLGDEAIFKVNKQLFPKFKFVNIHKNFTSIISFFGGGTLFPEWPFGAQINKYNYAYGIGVKDPSLWGEPKKYYIEAIKKNNFRFLTVRGYKSQEILHKYGIKSDVIGDPALSLKPTNYKHSNYKKIIINVGVPAIKMWGNKDKVLKEVIQFCKYMNQEGYHVYVMPVWDKDVPYCEELAEKANLMIFNDWKNIRKCLDFISDANIVIGEKLHSVVLSAACYVPFISLEYDPKCYEFAHSVGLEKFNLRTDKLSSKRLISIFNNLKKERTQVKKKLKLKVNSYRAIQYSIAKQITADIYAIPDDKLIIKHKKVHYLFDGIYKNILTIKYKSKLFR